MTKTRFRALTKPPGTVSTLRNAQSKMGPSRSSRRYRRSLFWLMSLALFAAGCNSELVPVTGTVTFQGQPLAHRHTGHLLPGFRWARRLLQRGGRQLCRQDRQSLGPEAARIRIAGPWRDKAPWPAGSSERPTAPPLLIPERYARPETSPLRYVVPTQGGAFDIAVDPFNP